MIGRPVVQVVPEVWSDERMHVLDESCWCKPELVEREGTVEMIHQVTDGSGDS